MFDFFNLNWTQLYPNLLSSIHSKDLSHEPRQDGPEVITTKSRLPAPPQVQNLSTIYASDDLMIGGSKHQVYELFRDRIITPRGYDGIEINNYFTKIDFSTFPLSSGPVNRPRCVLATLTSNFHMTIYTHLDRTRHNVNSNLDDKSTEEWVICLDISKLYNGIMYHKWTLAGEKNSGLQFEEYKTRLYQLTTLDFAWITPYGNEDGEENRLLNEAFIMTAQANGDILIWWIVVSPDSGQFTAEPVFTKNVVVNDIISTIKFHRVFENVGILAIGTNGGTVKVFRLEKLVNDVDIGSQSEPKFVMNNGFEIWEKDMMKIDVLESTKSSSEQNILKGPTLNLLIMKHPNHLLSTLITISISDIDFKPVEHFQSPEGPIVGISQYADYEFMLCHESGMLSFVVIKNGSICYREESVTSIAEDNSMNPNETYSYNGLALSPNRALVCVGKHLSCTFDHLAVRDPGRLVFFSLLPEDNAFDTVKDLYSGNQFSILKISDALVALRHHIRLKEDMNFDSYLHGKSICKMSGGELRLYFWLLKSMLLPEGDEDKYTVDELDIFRANRVAILLHHLEIEDAILRKHYSSLLKAIEKKKDLPEYKLSGTNAKSLCMIRKYLKSKSQKFPPEPSAQYEMKPSCPLCGDEVIYQEPIQDEVVFCGYSWEAQSCTNKHRFPVCILSLLPCDFPYRTCSSCRVTALITPTFGQQPVCPLCGELMLPFPVVGDDGESVVEADPENPDVDVPENADTTKVDKSKRRKYYRKQKKT